MKKQEIVKSTDTAYQSVRKILEEARKTCYTAVNFAMVHAYWNIGGNIPRSQSLPDQIRHAVRDELPIIRSELQREQRFLELEMEGTRRNSKL